MTLICALLSDYDNFMSLVLFLYPLSLNKLVAVFHTKEMQHCSYDTISATSFKTYQGEVFQQKEGQRKVEEVKTEKSNIVEETTSQMLYLT